MAKTAPTLAARARPVVKKAEAAAERPASAPSGEVRSVRIQRPGQPVAWLSLVDGERYVIGRHDAADVVFTDEQVSRLHGVLRRDERGWVYEDYGSSNGSALVPSSGRAVDLEPHRAVGLSPGDRVELGLRGSAIVASADLPPVVESGGRDPAALSAAARAFAERVRLAARTRVPVFLLGPSGAGKTFTARRIHEESRLPGPFVPINCARLPTEPTALHSELLGHVRGAYTGADSARTGKLVLADGGTLFLDEVESLPPMAQGFLLDVLEGTGDLAPLGSPTLRLKPPTFRLISASKAPLGKCGLRPDLCERLAEGHLWRVPTLEERREDIPGLVRRFAREQEGMLGVPVVLEQDAVAFAAQAAWPGQIRQLRAAVVALAQLGLARRKDDERDRGRPIVVREADFARHLDERAEAFGETMLGGGEPAPLRIKADARALTKAAVEQALARARGNKARAARALGIARNTLSRKAREFGIE